MQLPPPTGNVVESNRSVALDRPLLQRIDPSALTQVLGAADDRTPHGQEALLIPTQASAFVHDDLHEQGSFVGRHVPEQRVPPLMVALRQSHLGTLCLGLPPRSGSDVMTVVRLIWFGNLLDAKHCQLLRQDALVLSSL